MSSQVVQLEVMIRVQLKTFSLCPDSPVELGNKYHLLTSSIGTTTRNEPFT